MPAIFALAAVVFAVALAWWAADPTFALVLAAVMALIAFVWVLRSRSGNRYRKLSKQDRASLFQKQKGACNGCGRSFDDDLLQEDHIVPRAKGGEDTLENKQLLCGPCNATKGVGTMKQLEERNRKKGLIP